MLYSATIILVLVIYYLLRSTEINNTNKPPIKPAQQSISSKTSKDASSGDKEEKSNVTVTGNESRKITVETYKPMSSKNLLLALKNEEFDCTGFEQLESDEQVDIARAFRKEFILNDYENLNSYATLEREQLLELGNNNDKSAMFVLGMNYVWHSYNKPFTDPMLSSGARPVPMLSNYKSIDIDMLETGQNWLFNAAVNGYPSALVPLSKSYLITINAAKWNISQNEDDQEYAVRQERLIREQELQMLATTRLIVELMPTLADFAKAGNSYEERFSALKKEDIEQLDQIHSDQYSRWSNDREEMNKIAEVELPISAEDYIKGTNKESFLTICEKFVPFATFVKDR